jgi:hypothetical protein
MLAAGRGFDEPRFAGPRVTDSSRGPPAKNPQYWFGDDPQRCRTGSNEWPRPPGPLGPLAPRPRSTRVAPKVSASRDQCRSTRGAGCSGLAYLPLCIGTSSRRESDTETAIAIRESGTLLELGTVAANQPTTAASIRCVDTRADVSLMTPASRCARGRWSAYVQASAFARAPWSTRPLV